jgi:hypothetical protein
MLPRALPLREPAITSTAFAAAAATTPWRAACGAGAPPSECASPATPRLRPLSGKYVSPPHLCGLRMQGSVGAARRWRLRASGLASGLLASGGADGAIRMLCPDEQACLAVLDGRGGRVHALEAVPDGRLTSAMNSVDSRSAGIEPSRRPFFRRSADLLCPTSLSTVGLADFIFSALPLPTALRGRKAPGPLCRR